MNQVSANTMSTPSDQPVIILHQVGELLSNTFERQLVDRVNTGISSFQSSRVYEELEELSTMLFI